jgi:hypothetical protein
MSLLYLLLLRGTQRGRGVTLPIPAALEVPAAETGR